MRWTLRAMLAVGITAVSCLFTSGSALASAPNYGVITFEKVDQDGNLLGGAKIDGFSCTRSGNDNSWQCQSLNEYSWFDSTAGQTQPAWWDVELNGPYIPPTPPTSSLDLTGTTGASFTDDIPLRGTWALPIQHCLVLEEKAAPAGYQIRPGRSVFCAGPGGWTEANAVGFEAGPDRNASGGSWTVENVADSNGFPSSTTFRLMNTKSVTFDKRNETGELLAGGTFRAASCTWFDTPAVPAGDPDWSGGKQTPMFDDGYDQWHCAALDRSNISWFATGLNAAGTSGPIDTGGLRAAATDLLPRPGMASLTALYEERDTRPDGLVLGAVPDRHCVVVQETAAPDGYVLDDDPSVFCRSAGSWTAINDPDLTLPAFQNERPVAAIAGPWEVRGTSFTLANTPKGVVPIPGAPPIIDGCNPPGVTSNVAWASQLPANTQRLTWSADSRTGARTVALADPAVSLWENGSINPIAFQLPPDSGVTCAPGEQQATTVPSSPSTTMSSLSTTVPGQPTTVPFQPTMLPATGAGVSGKLAVAFGLILIGGMVVAGTRRRTRHS